MRQTKGAIGNLLNRYRAVLKKCHLLNVFGSLAVAGMLVMGGADIVNAQTYTGIGNQITDTTIEQQKKSNGGAFWLTDDTKNNTSTLEITNSQFNENTATGTGGAGGIGTNGGTLTVESSSFNSNSAGYGGALGIFKGANIRDTSFTGNKATMNDSDAGGGALFLGSESTTVLDNVEFHRNSSETFGGAIGMRLGTNPDTGQEGDRRNNSGATLSINNSRFIQNSASKGGAIYNTFYNDGTNNPATITSSYFENNNATFGGAIYNSGIYDNQNNTSSISLSDTIFKNNTASEAGGALYNDNTATSVIDNVLFDGNKAKQGGAINNAQRTVKATDDNGLQTGPGKLSITNSRFINNEAQGSQGGAIRNEGTIEQITNSEFSDNTAHNGGAINNGTLGIINLISDSRFDNNKATTQPLQNAAEAFQGGAITNAGIINLIQDTDFTNNETTGSGGAIANVKPQGNGYTASLALEDVTVSGNKAGREGGGIYNDADQTVTLQGTNTFTDNTANGQANDITNKGAVSIASGTTTLNSGYLQNESANASLTVQDGATLESYGTMEIQTGTATFETNSLLAVNGRSISATDATAAIVVGDGAILEVQPGAGLRIDNARVGETYNIVDASSDMENDALANWSISTDSAMVQLIRGDDGKIQMAREEAAKVYPGLSSGAVAALNSLYDNQLNDTESRDPGARFLTRATSDRYLGADKTAAVEQVESAARIAVAGAVPQMTKMAADSATNAVVNRLGLANPNSGVQAINADGQLVPEKALGLALWIAPLWQNQRGFGMEAGNLDYGYSANLGGVSLGADYTFENAIRAGLMFHIGGGYAQSQGDLYDTSNSMFFWGIGAYGGWEYNNFAVMADVSYTSTWNDVKQDLDSRMGMGSELEADIQAAAISAGLRFEYKLETSVLDLIPHVGVRYMNIRTWGYDVDSDAGTVLEGDGFNQNIWTFPVGVTFSKDIEMNNGWSFKPSLDFTVIPAAGDIKAKEDVRFTGVPGSYEMETQMMDYLTWQGGVGVEFGNDTVSIGVNYTLQAGVNSTGHGVFGMFRYEF